MKAMMEKQRKEAAKNAKKRKGKSGFELSASSLLEEMGGDDEDGLGGDAPMVKLGDASTAAPFTSKMPSIRSTVDIIRQGRGALLTTLQMYQILALNCLISSYSLSVLYLDGIKYGDKQMTCSGILMMIAFFSISRVLPLDRLASCRPLNSVFHPALFLSLIGQVGSQLTIMIFFARVFLSLISLFSLFLYFLSLFIFFLYFLSFLS